MTRFGKYFVAGMIASVVGFALFAGMVKLVGWPWYIAGTISFTAATLVNYVTSINHVFTSSVRFKMRTEIALIFAVSLIGLAVNQVILFLLIRRGLPVLLAKIGATGTVFLWNYGARQHFVFACPVPSHQLQEGKSRPHEEV